MIRKNGAVRTTKPVDCPSGAADNGDMDRFGSRRVWENSQRGCLILRHPKSYLPTHSVIHKSAIRVLAIFADASRTGYAEAKSHATTELFPRATMQAAQATLRQRARRCIRAARRRMQAAQATLRQSSYAKQIRDKISQMQAAQATLRQSIEFKCFPLICYGCKPHRLLCKAKANACRKAGNI